MPPDDAIEASITRVLDAEAAALDAVAHARVEALAIAEQAREQVRRLGVNTDRRMHAVRAAFEARVAAEVASLAAQTSALEAIHDLTPEEIGSVERAVGATALALTGGRA